jgi:ferrochelatase
MNGLLLINLGTPDAPAPGAVRRYLRQFLSDPRVLDMHPVARALLLYLIILPLRPRRSAAAYQKIWTAQGSPLLHHSQALSREVAARLPGWRVELGMRYSRPSIPAALDRLLAAPLERLWVLPLYPQYSSAATGSSVEEVFRVLGRRVVVPPVTVVGPFHADPGFLAAFAAQGAPLLQGERPDHVLFSFHGLPERQVRKADPTGQHCLARPDCCAGLGPRNQDCYRAQCFATARALARRGLGGRRGLDRRLRRWGPRRGGGPLTIFS